MLRWEGPLLVIIDFCFDIFLFWEEFGKNYVLLVPAGAEEDADGQIEIQAYSFTENEDGTEGALQPIPEDADAEWIMIEEVFNSFLDEDW